MAVKRLREEEATTMADRLSDMPELVQLRILSFLDARHAVATSLLSKSWASLWTCAPVLNFSSYRFSNLNVFNNFVANALSRRQPVKLEKLTFKHGGVCSDKILEEVFGYAFSHGVEELEADVNEIEMWPIGLHTYSDSLTRLRLESQAGCWFFKPGSGSFQNLTVLHLKGVIIIELDPFSGFLMLNKLSLMYCVLKTKDNALNVHARELKEFSVAYNDQQVSRCEFATPKLKHLEWRGSNFPHLKTHHGGFPVLETAIIDYNGDVLKKQDNQMIFDDLVKLFDSLCNAKSLTVFSSVVHLLISCPYELANRYSPFRGLKRLKLDLTSFRDRIMVDALCKLLMESLRFVPVVKANLLHRSQDAKCTMMVNGYNERSSCSFILHDLKVEGLVTINL